jgi:ABC-type hemin transport system ATPase subunit
MSLVLSICDRVVALEFGHVIADGTAEEVRRDKRVVAAYLGDSVELARPPAGPAPAGTTPVGTAAPGQAEPTEAG